jgi:ribonuclease P protein subunit POP4
MKVVDSTDPTLINRSGVVVDETKNMLNLANDNGAVVFIPKATSMFELDLQGKKILISGKDIIGTPQERIHKI